MAWKKLADRLTDLPLVLAGPMLRRVIPNAVTVWVALSQSATVSLTVYDGDGADAKKLMTAKRATTAMGTNLHIVAVTARSDTPLDPGSVYFYDLSFSGDFGKKSLTEAVGTLTVPLAYPPFKLPSFALPPGLADLRLIHGSCRKPHAGGPDALALLDGLIAATAASGTERPHQLVLTGDQIYADDVSDSLLLLLTDAGDTLLGWTESLPAWSNEGSHKAADLPPYWRDQLLKDAGFTSDDRRSHLMSFGEWLAMYLFVWSDVLWPATLPDYDEILQKAKAGDTKAKLAFLHNYRNIKTDTDNVASFLTTIPNVRRALANIPSYMICDDHEITDDWNITRRFCDGVYGNELGVRMITNGLAAFSVCQAWGNAPEWFDDDPQNPAGLKLLKLLDSPTGLPGHYEAVSPAIQPIVGVHHAAELAQQSPYRVFHEAGFSIEVNGVWVNDKSLAFNFSVEGPEHQVIVTDTRTWRSFPDPDPDSHSNLLPEDQMIQQLENAPPALAGRLLLVVVTTNIPPIATIRLLARVDVSDLYEYDLFDSWELPTLWFDRMIVHLSHKLAKTGGVYSGQVVMLSGDVHHSFSSRFAYWADDQLGNVTGSKQAANVVIPQLVSSALHNQSDKTIGVHREGYGFAPDDWKAQIGAYLVTRNNTESYVGWNWTSGNALRVGDYPASLAENLAGGSISGAGQDDPAYIYADEPTIPATDKFFDYLLTGKPKLTMAADYHYRLDYLVASAGQQAPNPPAIAPVAAGASDADRKKAAKAYYDAAGAYRDYYHAGSDSRDAVGMNNIGEVTFGWDPPKFVYHTLRWLKPGESKIQWARYDIAVEPESPTANSALYPLLKADGEP